MDERDRNEALEDENRRLREALYCIKKGIPEEYREDITLIARYKAEQNGTDFETAADEAAERYKGIFTPHARRSGTAMQRMKSDDTALRRAFGLDVKGE